MSLNKIILEALERNPVALKESLSSILSEKIANAIDKRMDESVNVLDKHSVKEDLDESVKDGYYVSNSMKVIHDKPFKDSKSAIRHADTHENKTGRVHHVTKVKDGKVEKQWAYNGGHHEGGWEHYSDYKGDDAHHHLLGLHKNSVNESQEIDLSEGLESGDYSLKKTGEKKSTTAHPNGKDIFHIYHKDEKIGSVEPYSGYKETRKPGARIVSSRKDVTHYAVRFDKDKGPRSGNGNDQISVRASHGHALPAHALETAVREHSWWKKSIKEDLDENTEMKGDHLISAKLIHKDLKNIDSLSPDTQKILKRHEKQMITKYGNDWRKKAGILEEFEQLDELSKKTLRSYGSKAIRDSLSRRKSDPAKSQKRSDGVNLASAKVYPSQYQNSPLKAKIVAKEHFDQLDEVISKSERRNLAYHEKQAVRAAEKANVGALPRSDKEKWIDDYIAKNFIPKGAVGSAVYSGVMKVRSTKVEK